MILSSKIHGLDLGLVGQWPWQMSKTHGLGLDGKWHWPLPQRPMTLALKTLGLGLSLGFGVKTHCFGLVPCLENPNLEEQLPWLCRPEAFALSRRPTTLDLDFFYLQPTVQSFGLFCLVRAGFLPQMCARIMRHALFNEFCWSSGIFDGWKWS